MDYVRYDKLSSFCFAGVKYNVTKFSILFLYRTIISKIFLAMYIEQSSTTDDTKKIIISKMNYLFGAFSFRIESPYVL